jgi:hypothetical protein
MKPTPPITPDREASPSFPLTDYNFQPTVETPASSCAVPAAKKSPAFHKLSSEVFGQKTTGEHFAELFVFVVISALVAWPVLAMLHAITRMVRNY